MINKRYFFTIAAMCFASLAHSQANTSLSNLSAPTAVNVDLVPVSDNAIDLGSNLKSFRNIVADGIITINGFKLRNNAALTSMVYNSNGSPLLTTGSDNTVMGFNAGGALTNGVKNTIFGSGAGASLQGGGSNTFIGANAGANASSTGNTAVGANAGANLSDSGMNTLVGFESGLNTNGSNNTYIGNGSGKLNTSGNGNVFIGTTAGDFNTTGSNLTIIGNNADVTSATLTNASAFGNGANIAVSNAMSFGNTGVVRWGFANNLLGVATTKALIVGSTASNGNGAFLTNGGTWTNTSTAAAKDRIIDLDKTDILARVNQLHISKWAYKGTDEFHIGPMAEEFYNLFEVGVDDKSVSTIDPAGVALVAIQELSSQLEASEELMHNLQEKLDALNYQLGSDENKIESLEFKVSEKLKCAPVPADGYIMVNTTTSSTTGVVQLINQQGVVVLEQKIAAGNCVQTEISTAHLSPGFYQMVLLEAGQKVASQHVVIAR